MIRAIGPYTVDNKARTVTAQDGATVHLSKRLFDVLDVLARNNGQAVAHDDFAVAYPGIPDDLVQGVRDSVMKLRRRLPGLEIHTVPGFGYRVERAAVLDGVVTA